MCAPPWRQSNINLFFLRKEGHKTGPIFSRPYGEPLEARCQIMSSQQPPSDNGGRECAGSVLLLGLTGMRLCKRTHHFIPGERGTRCMVTIHSCILVAGVMSVQLAELISTCPPGAAFEASLVDQATWTRWIGVVVVGERGTWTMMVQLWASRTPCWSTPLWSRDGGRRGRGRAQ